MEEEFQKIAEYYGRLSEPELMDLARGYGELTAQAQEALREEFKSRSLEPPLLEPEDDSPEEVPVERPMVTVGVYRDMPGAIVARSVLEAEGIECFLANENTVRMDWFWSNLLGGMRLQVEAKDEERAREILAQPIPESFALNEGEEFVQPVCPVCGSLDIGPDDSDRKVLAVSMLVGLPLPHRKPPPERWLCSSCGCRWEDDGETPTVARTTGLPKLP